VESEAAKIRIYRQEDREDLYQICLLTADSGNDATSLFSDPRLPGHVWLGPYLAFEPTLAFVAEDSKGVAGYVVAALDTPAFEDRLERDWWPPLRARYPQAAQSPAEAVSPIEQAALNDMHRPWDVVGDLVGRFPSHLHIDLLPRIQGRGIGRKLMATALSSLRDRGSRGLHLLVARGNERAAGFYRHIGFSELPNSYVRVFTIGLDPGSG
jgi:ribosomal protein S18 acetylase RimI-like enzyme